MTLPVELPRPTTYFLSRSNYAVTYGWGIRFSTSEGEDTQTAITTGSGALQLRQVINRCSLASNYQPDHIDDCWNPICRPPAKKLPKYWVKKQWSVMRGGFLWWVVSKKAQERDNCKVLQRLDCRRFVQLAVWLATIVQHITCDHQNLSNTFVPVCGATMSVFDLAYYSGPHHIREMVVRQRVRVASSGPCFTFSLGGGGVLCADLAVIRQKSYATHNERLAITITQPYGQIIDKWFEIHHPSIFSLNMPSQPNKMVSVDASFVYMSMALYWSTFAWCWLTNKSNQSISDCVLTLWWWWGRKEVASLGGWRVHRIWSQRWPQQP